MRAALEVNEPRFWFKHENAVMKVGDKVNLEVGDGTSKGYGNNPIRSHPL